MPFNNNDLGLEPSKNLSQIFEDIKNATEIKKRNSEILLSPNFKEQIEKNIREILEELSFNREVEQNTFKRGNIKINITITEIESEETELEINVVTEVLKKKRSFSGKIKTNENCSK